MKSAIITGATGAIGTALIEELIRNGVRVLVFCREDSRRKERIPNHPLVIKRYCSLNQLCEIQNETGEH